ncbi:MAG: hypothetical protein M1818_005758 [Claussenomyces sp. TS43310]|nr:MAG: hypothetical protein M1818_005758 [Claussenomyces sp. TS43310]
MTDIEGNDGGLAPQQSTRADLGSQATRDSLRITSRTASSHAQVRSDGRVDIGFFHKSNLAHTLKAALHYQEEAPKLIQTPSSLAQYRDIPRLNIVVQIVGSRGDVQPFVALAQVLVKPPYNHRVRFCTHPVFKDFVEDAGLEFFSIGGDPAVLMAYMVNNPGIIPGVKSLRGGEIKRRRRDIAINLRAAWRSCIEPSEGDMKPFIADAIIANPPSFAHIHCAEKLAIPLHIMFTMPWSPTQAFPHPLANVKASNVDKPISNYLSYTLVDLMTWQGLGDIINDFRRSLRLEPISALWGGGIISRLEVPHTYCWSTALIPKPKDWGPHITISGFFFLGLASNYTPPAELVAFLEAGPPPVYIGFGSIVVDDPVSFTSLIFEALKLAGVRAIVSKGWGGIGGEQPPDDVFLLGNCPHDWLFPRVSCVVHHGGAGTTATGIALGKPTVVVPFFGDQPFWGEMIHRGGAGPKPIPYKELTAQLLASSIEFALEPEAVEAAAKMAEQIQNEDGKTVGAEQFHNALHFDDMRCQICPPLLAVWNHKPTGMNLSALAATVLMKQNCVDVDDLRIIRHKEWIVDPGPLGPAQGSISAVLVKASAHELGIHAHHHDHGDTGIFPESRNPATNGHHGLSPASHGADGGLVNKRESRLSRLQTRSLSRLRGPLNRSRSHQSGNPSSTGALAPVADSERQDSGVVDMALTKTRTRKSLHHGASFGRGQERFDRAQDHSTDHLYSRRDVSHAFPGFLKQVNPFTTIWSERKKKLSLRRAKQASKHKPERQEVIRDIASTMGLVIRTFIKIPMDLTYNIAVGCHNLPTSLCSDDTVRKPMVITGVPSGLVAAGREFTLGFYDGLTGVVTQPYRGVRREGASGLAKGFGTGLVGLLFKTSAGVWAIPGFTLKGVHQELRKLRHSGTLKYVRRSRIIQGLREWDRCSEGERKLIIRRWYKMTKQKEKA